MTIKSRIFEYIDQDEGKTAEAASSLCGFHAAQEKRRRIFVFTKEELKFNQQLLLVASKVSL